MITLSLRALWFGCITKHHEPIWTSDHMECLTCGTVIDVLPQPTVRGPAHEPSPVRGVPKMRAVTVGRVASMRRSA